MIICCHCVAEGDVAEDNVAEDDVGPSSLEELIEAPQDESTKFVSLEGIVSEKTLNAVADMGFTDMMEIQHKSIRPLLEGRYVMMPKAYERVVL